MTASLLLNYMNPYPREFPCLSLMTLIDLISAELLK